MRKTLGNLLVIVTLAVVFVFLGMAAEGVDEGKAVFLKRCKMCHGTNGEGNPAMARMLKVEFKPMESEYIQKKTDGEIKSIIQKGKGRMVAVRGISEGEIEAVTAFLRSLKK